MKVAGFPTNDRILRQGEEQSKNPDHWNCVDCDPDRVGDCGVGWMERAKRPARISGRANVCDRYGDGAGSNIILVQSALALNDRTPVMQFRALPQLEIPTISQLERCCSTALIM
jgi:hypothetical protein